MTLVTIETILERLGIDIGTLHERDAAEIVSIVLICMIEDVDRSLENFEMPISDMLWIDNE